MLISCAEYAKAQEALGDISDDYAIEQYSRRGTPVRDVCCDLLDALPIVSDFDYLPRGLVMNAAI